jgi:hypothetical protein
VSIKKMKSGGQMSSQSSVVWWYREVNCEVVGMCVEEVPVLGAEVACLAVSASYLMYVTLCMNTHTHHFVP